MTPGTRYGDLVTSESIVSAKGPTSEWAADCFFEVRKKLMNVDSHQVHATLKTTRRGIEMIPPIPYIAIPDLTREGVRGFVDAEKAVIVSMTRKRAEARPWGRAVRSCPSRINRAECNMAGEASTSVTCRCLGNGIAVLGSTARRSARGSLEKWDRSKNRIQY